MSGSPAPRASTPTRAAQEEGSDTGQRATKYELCQQVITAGEELSDAGPDVSITDWLPFLANPRIAPAIIGTQAVRDIVRLALDIKGAIRLVQVISYCFLCVDYDRFKAQGHRALEVFLPFVYQMGLRGIDSKPTADDPRLLCLELVKVLTKAVSDHVLGVEKKTLPDHVAHNCVVLLAEIWRNMKVTTVPADDVAEVLGTMSGVLRGWMAPAAQEALRRGRDLVSRTLNVFVLLLRRCVELDPYTTSHASYQRCRQNLHLLQHNAQVEKGEWGKITNGSVVRSALPTPVKLHRPSGKEKQLGDWKVKQHISMTVNHPKRAHDASPVHGEASFQAHMPGERWVQCGPGRIRPWTTSSDGQPRTPSPGPNDRRSKATLGQPKLVASPHASPDKFQTPRRSPGSARAASPSPRPLEKFTPQRTEFLWRDKKDLPTYVSPPRCATPTQYPYAHLGRNWNRNPKDSPFAKGNAASPNYITERKRAPFENAHSSAGLPRGEASQQHGAQGGKVERGSSKADRIARSSIMFLQRMPSMKRSANRASFRQTMPSADELEDAAITIQSFFRKHAQARREKERMEEEALSYKTDGEIVRAAIMQMNARYADLEYLRSFLEG